MKFGTHNLGTNTYNFKEGIFEKIQNGRFMTNQSSVTIKSGRGLIFKRVYRLNRLTKQHETWYTCQHTYKEGKYAILAQFNQRGVL